jgi:colanic acid biosynthesis glycosyl transferase WcaI
MAVSADSRQLMSFAGENCHLKRRKNWPSVILGFSNSFPLSRGNVPEPLKLLTNRESCGTLLCHPQERSPRLGQRTRTKMSDSSKPRVLFLNRSYWPDSEATGQLLTALCEGLADQFDVHVLAGQPNANASGNEWANVSTRNRVTIHRVKHTTFPKSNMALKAVNFLSFIRACRRQVLSLPTPDIVVFETDPFLLPFVADKLQRGTGCRMIGYLQDIYPDVAVALKKVSNSWLIRRLRKKMFSIYHRCDAIVVLSDDMKSVLLNDGIAEQKVRIVPNWADTDSIHPVDLDNKFIEEHGLQNKFVAMYSGNLGLTQRLEEFVEAAEHLKGEPEIQFVFVGQGARRKNLEEQVSSLGLTNVMFLDYQPLDQLSHSLSAADLHLVPLTQELAHCLMPSKLYGILAVGRPYLTNAPETSELHRITVKEQVGIAVEAGDSKKIAAAISKALRDRESLAAMGCRGRRLAEQLYTKTRAIGAFSKLLTEYTGHQSTA